MMLSRPRSSSSPNVPQRAHLWLPLVAALLPACTVGDEPAGDGPDAGADEVEQTTAALTSPDPCNSERADIPLAYHYESGWGYRRGSLSIVNRATTRGTFAVYTVTPLGERTRILGPLELAGGAQQLLVDPIPLTPTGPHLAYEIHGTVPFASLVNAQAAGLLGEYEVYSSPSSGYGAVENTKIFVPGVNQTLGGSRATKSVIWLKNKTCTPSSVKVSFIDNAGTIRHETYRLLQDNGWQRLDVTEFLAAQGVTGFQGSVRVDASLGVAVAHDMLHFSGSTLKLYGAEPGLPQGDVSTNVYAPQLMQNNYGYNTDLIVHNPAPYQQNAWITFHTTGGSASCAPAAISARALAARSTTTFRFNAACTWIGFARIRVGQSQSPPVVTSPGGIVATVRQYSPTTLATFVASHDEGLTGRYVLPVLHQANHGYFSGVTIINPSTAEARVRFSGPPSCAAFAHDATLGASIDTRVYFTIPAGGARTLTWPATGCTYSGRAVVASENNVPFVMAATQLGTGTSYDSFASERAIPMIESGGTRACFYVRNNSVLAGLAGHIAFAFNTFGGKWTATSTENTEAITQSPAYDAEFEDSQTWYRTAAITESNLEAYMASTSPNPWHPGSNYHEVSCTTLGSQDRFKAGRALNHIRTNGYEIPDRSCLDHAYFVATALGVPTGWMSSPSWTPDPENFFCDLRWKVDGAGNHYWDVVELLYPGAPRCD